MSNTQQPNQMTQPNQLVQKMKITESDITGAVLNKITAFESNGELRLPGDYSPANALKSAWLILQDVQDKNGKKALEVCTKESIANALLKMIVWGLSPLKNQGYFIVYGGELTFTPDYSGNILLAKRYGGLKSIKANAIFEGDEFQFEVDAETGRKRIVKHAQTLESIGSNKIKGAYAVFELEDGTRDVEIMNHSQILASWQQGAAKGNSPAHTKFPDQMAMKTVINRACKLLIRSSDDSVLYDQEDDNRDPVVEGVKSKIRENANKEALTFEEAEVVEETPKSNATEQRGVQTEDKPVDKPQAAKTSTSASSGIQPSIDFD